MLKIKDNVDLKILGKFGFYSTSDTYGFNNDDYDIGLVVFKETRQIIIYSAMYGGYEDGEKVEPKLYDLIMEGLVEKVEE